MGSIRTSKEVERELPTFVRVYKDGTVERLSGTPYVPPCLEDPKIGVASKDITICEDPLIRARLFLPKHEPVTEQPEKLPNLVHYHGGSCISSAFSLVEHQYLTTLVAEAKILAVSVEHRFIEKLRRVFFCSFAHLQLSSPLALSHHLAVPNPSLQ
ncbi:2-hydroxyisoflavanone dehydratase-like [Eucalyptus grandis]|uniref:2-hydroxyisoflavanone dehydratase-like n=1 Tax=Eucalyptus grandis TaxID=71139 RepID=UPI00192F003F|nr:2-hydroxyisoflavanone dehydratase-like [Eucalyptus grandis]